MTVYPPSPSGLRVALLAEGVGRNAIWENVPGALSSSPSSRRAWVEIVSSLVLTILLRSPSSRRAWVEIYSWRPRNTDRRLSPSSRRAWVEIYALSRSIRATMRRPPRGGRG